MRLAAPPHSVSVGAAEEQVAPLPKCPTLLHRGGVMLLGSLVWVALVQAAANPRQAAKARQR